MKTKMAKCRRGRIQHRYGVGKYVTIVCMGGDIMWLSHYTGELCYLGDHKGLKCMFRDFRKG